jgi:sterol desaturase/sphingolipid hydroxylase (fatty acid hydroxylase superfamily)
MDDPHTESLHRIEGDVESLTSLSFVAVLLEAFLDWRLRAPRDFRETRANLLVAVGQDVLGRLVGGPIALFFLGLVAAWVPWRVPIGPTSWVVGFVVADFFYYWTHRLEHRCRLLWAHHGVHHSSSDFDFSTADRIAWSETLIFWYGLVPLVLLGFSPLQVVVLSSLLLLAQTWIHTRKVGRLGVLEGWINTPSAHRVHHGSNPEYLDANYGAVLMVWDRIFGTYVSETVPVRFGLTTPLETHDPLRINAHEYVFLARKLASAKTLRERLLWLFGPPEWSDARGFAATREGSMWHALATRFGWRTRTELTRTSSRRTSPARSCS